MFLNFNEDNYVVLSLVDGWSHFKTADKITLLQPTTLEKLCNKGFVVTVIFIPRYALI